MVTGASGFVGGAVCATMLAGGHEVSSLVRKQGSEPPGTQPVTGDLASAPSLEEAVRRAEPECVIHLAAEIATQRDVRRIEEVNVRGMERLLRACATAQVRRLVFASTMVTGDARGAVLTEEQPLPVQTAYGRSKQEGERLLGESPLEGVVIRPGHIYGSGGWYASEIVARLRKPGRFVVLGSGENWWDVVHVEDVARAIALVAEKAPPGSTYHCADDHPITQGDFLALTARELGVGAPRHVPLWLARLAAGRDSVLAVTRSARASNAKLRRELGWEPHFPTAQLGVPAALAGIGAPSGGSGAQPI